MGMAAPDKTVSFGPPVTRLRRIEAELRRLDEVLAFLLDESWRLKAPWFEGHEKYITCDPRPRPEHWARK